jgi:eukaryotic translation initiation factor 2C
MLLIKKLQMEVAADIFTPPAVFDGRKNMFAARELPLGPTDAKTVCS